jgi:hypothetical protein
MDEIKKESEPLADKLTVRGTFEISATRVQELDSLLLEIKKKQEQFFFFSLDVTCKWETMQTHIESVDGIDQRIVKIKNLPADHWSVFVCRIRDIETEVITYINRGKQENEQGVVPVFTCSAKLKIEYKDKEAQKVLENDKQLELFRPIDIQEKRYHEEVAKFIDEMKPDGKNIESITFTHIREDGSRGEEVELSTTPTLKG